MRELAMWSTQLSVSSLWGYHICQHVLCEVVNEVDEFLRVHVTLFWERKPSEHCGWSPLREWPISHVMVQVSSGERIFPLVQPGSHAPFFGGVISEEVTMQSPATNEIKTVHLLRAYVGFVSCKGGKDQYSLSEPESPPWNLQGQRRKLLHKRSVTDVKAKRHLSSR